jgi:hypothetical protein
MENERRGDAVHDSRAANAEGETDHRRGGEPFGAEQCACGLSEIVEHADMRAVNGGGRHCLSGKKHARGFQRQVRDWRTPPNLFTKAPVIESLEILGAKLPQ